MTDYETKSLHKSNVSESFDNLSLSNWTVKKDSPPASNDEEPCKEPPITKSLSSNALIPEYFKKTCLSPKSIELRVIYDAPTSQATYHYSVTWDEEFEATEVSVSPAKIHQEEFTPVTSKCDGPCQREFPSNLLNTIGRCDHYLCTACYGLVKNSDGTNGCSSRQCFWNGENSETEICQRPRARSISEMSSNSLCSEDCSLFSMTLSVVSIIPIQDNSKIRTMLVVVESIEEYGMCHTYVELNMNPSLKLMDAIRKLLYRKRKIFEDYLPKCSLYFAVIISSEKAKIRRVKKKFWPSLLLMDIPKLGDRKSVV